MKAKRINFQHEGQLIDGTNNTLRIDGLRLEVRKGAEVPMPHLVPLRGGKPVRDAIAVPALDLDELAQSISAMNDALAKEPWDNIT